MMRLHKTFSLVLLLIGATACSNFAELDDISPNDQIGTDEAVTDFNSAAAALNGLYDELQDGTLVFDGYLALPQYFSDEAIFTGTFPTRLEFGNFNVFPANGTMAGVFTDFYDVINVANNLIDLLPTIEDPSLTDAVVNDFIGQARMVRALSYFYLTQGWGDVPLVTTPTSSDNVGDALSLPASPRSDVLNQIMDDLEFAQTNITETDSERATAAAASALAARVELIRGNYQAAYDNAITALGGEGFDLTAFEYLQDRIFTLNFTTVDANSLNFFYGPAEFGGRHSIEPSPSLIAGYEDGDLRFAQSIDLTSATVPFSLKYNDFRGAGQGTDPVYFIRHAEMVLVAAEAAAELGEFDNASDWINQVRTRAGLPDVTLTADNYVDLILQERFIELSLEAGHRLWDLRRRGRALEVLGPLGYDSCDGLWPLPQRDVDRNVNLNQNDCCNC